VTREPGTLSAHPVLKRRDQRRDPDLPHGVPFFRGQAVDLAFDVEDRIDPAHRFDRQRRLRDICQYEQFASSMCPTGGFGNRARLARRMIKIIEAGICVSLKNPHVILQMQAWMLPTSIG
jgi:hypothetical protein